MAEQETLVEILAEMRTQTLLLARIAEMIVDQNRNLTTPPKALKELTEKLIPTRS